MKKLKKTLALAALSLAVLTFSPRAEAGGLDVYHLYVIWLSGEGEGDQANLDAFIACLYDHSNYFDYWGGDVLVVEEGSYVVPPPSSGVLGAAGEIGPFIESVIASGAVPAPPSWGTPVYQIMVDPYQTSCSLGGGTGGSNALGTVNGQTAGLIITTTNPNAFWPARTPLGGETTLTEHEVAEVIDGLRGGDRCCGDFCCEGWCNSAPSCENLQGLSCPGAPASTFTGSSSCGSVTGWLVQTLTHTGASTCYGTVTCDFALADECTSGGETLHAPCKADSDCCSGTICAAWTYTGSDPAPVCCKPAGASCALGTDCCGGMACTGGTCVCVPEGSWCASDVDCCAGLVCSGSACAAAPSPEPGPEAGTGSGGRDGGADASMHDGGWHHHDGGMDGGSFGPTQDTGGCAIGGPVGERASACEWLALGLALAAPVVRARRGVHRRRGRW